MTTLSRDFRRFLAIALLLAAVMLVQALVVEPIVAAHKRFGAEWNQNAALLGNYRRIVGAAGQLAEARASLERDSSAAPAYLTAPSPTIAATELQSKLQAAIGRHSAQLIGMRVLEPGEDGAFRLVGMRVTLTAGLTSLQAILHELEATVPLLFIDELVVQRKESPPAPRPGSPMAGAKEPALDVSFNLLAYVLRKES
jgi:general secretion pathway protein M